MEKKIESIEVLHCPGELPEFGPHSVIFVANLFSLFFGNNEQRKTLEQEIQGVDTYGGRLIPLINLLYRGGNNLLILDQEPDSSLHTYFTDTLGLSLPLIRPKVDQLESMIPELATHPALFMDGFVTDQQLEQVAEQADKVTLSSHIGSHNGNNKLALHSHMEQSEFPTIETHLAANPSDAIALLPLIEEDGYTEAVFKAQVGASGIGVLRLPVKGTVEADLPKELFFEGPCMVQGWIKPGIHGIEEVRSPSVQLYLKEGKLYLYDITEQFLSHGGTIHEGNLAIPEWIEENEALRAELLAQAEYAGRWLYGQGYRGTASVDFITLETKRGHSVYVCEINARVTGATYPAVLARHFMPRGAWLMRNLKLSKPISGELLLQQLQSGDLLYTPEQKSGILPINLNMGKDGKVQKGQFLFLASEPQACRELLTSTSQLPEFQWISDRD